MKKTVWMIVAALLMAATLAAKAQSFTGSLSIDPTFTNPNPPVVGGQLSLLATVSGPIPDPQGGDSTLLYGTVQCFVGLTKVYEETRDIMSPMPGQTNQYFGIFFPTSAGNCYAYLWLDGAHKPKRTDRNTIGPPFNFQVN